MCKKATEPEHGDGGGAGAWLAWCVCAVALVAGAAAAAFPLFATDTACRYAPMAEAFAQCDWAEAFHPRFGVGLQAIAGMLCFATGCDGYSACAAAATFAWALGAWPVFRIAERLWGARTAWFAAILYLLCPQPLVWALKGLREPFKMLGVLFMADALSSLRTDGWRSAAKAVAGLWLMFMFKCDAILPGALLAVAYAIADRFRRRSLVVAAAGAAALQPMCALVWSWTGWWLPAPQYVTLWQKAFGG